MDQESQGRAERRCGYNHEQEQRRLDIEEA
jgi:hypothetical protein